jgi:tRNA(fMet)-specific endonuclease VapC
MAENSARQLPNYARVNQFAGKHLIVSCDEYTSLQYAKLRFKLKKKGRPIPENDLWIAAIALQYQVPLLTRDQHFQYVDGLTIVSWS